mgnify:CR=1 FL=1
MSKSFLPSSGVERRASPLMPFHIPILAVVICLSHPAALHCAPQTTPSLNAVVDDSVAWTRVLGQSGLFLGVQNTLRMVQDKTRAKWKDLF